MCLRRVNWRQYTLSILLLIIVLASNSSQHKLIGSPRPFQRYSKAVGTEQDGFLPIVPPTEYKPAATPAAPSSVSATDVTKHDESVTTMKAAEAVEADRRIDNDETTDEKKDENDTQAIRSINHSIQELRDMTMDFLSIIKQNGIQKRSTDQQRNFITDYLLSDQVINRVKKFTEKYIFQTGSSSAFQNIVPAGGRLFFFKGMTNWFWFFFYWKKSRLRRIN